MPRRYASILALAIAALAIAAPGAGAAVPDQRPNVVVVVTDDQSLAQFTPEYMPRTFKHFVSAGTDFGDAIVATPLCCPSRAALSTGQYGHNNGVLRNNYQQLHGKRNVLPAWLRRSGYLTMHVGRFYNGYGLRGRNSRVAPGWDVWRTVLEPHSYYDYRMRFNDRFYRFGSRDRDYLTTRINRITAKLIRRRSGRRKPFYLQVDQLAPHWGPDNPTPACAGTAEPAPRDLDAYAAAPLPTGPAFNEADISDKPDFFQGVPLIEGKRLDLLRRSWRCTLASLREVDRGMASIWRELRGARELRRTAVLFTSDNAYLYGEHRIDLDKHYPYEEAIRVPLSLRLPRASAPGGQPAHSGAPAANIDIAPTILELTGAEPCKASGCRVLDGRSLVSEAAGVPEIPRDRAIAMEYDGDRPRKGLVCSYQGLRALDVLYVEHLLGRSQVGDPCAPLTGAEELYDLDADPYELQNLLPAAAGSPTAQVRAALRARSAALADCSGIAGRDPIPAGAHRLRVARPSGPGILAGAMICPDCGNENRDGARFCDGCGRPLSPEPAPGPTAAEPPPGRLPRRLPRTRPPRSAPGASRSRDFSAREPASASTRPGIGSARAR